MIFSALQSKWKRFGALGAALCVAACGGGRVIKAASEPPPPFSAERGEGWARAESLWADRSTTSSAWAALVAYRRAAEEQPDVAELWTRYSEAASFVATYIEANETWSNPERRRGLYHEGARAAENALRLHPDYRFRLAESGDEAVAAQALRGEWLQPAFWLAANRGRQALSESAWMRFAGRERFENLVRALVERDDALHHGGPHRFLGVMFVVLPDARDLDSARAHFARAQALSPLYFANHTLRAEHLATAQRDSASFRELLEWVIETRADTLPEAAVENAFEQARARELLARQAEFFP